MLLYLNGGLTGGETVFYKDHGGERSVLFMCIALFTIAMASLSANATAIASVRARCVLILAMNTAIFGFFVNAIC